MKFFILFIGICLNASNLHHAKVYKEYKTTYNFWLMSEKLDGIRAYWDTKELKTKKGNKIFAPLWFTKKLPNFELDGELWTKRADFENIQSIVLDKKPSIKWKEITYNIFEVPKAKGNFYKRLEKIKIWQKKYKNKYLNIIEQKKVFNETNMNKYLNYLLSLKAEGLIIKNPHLEYFKGRSKNILKVKKFFDDEAQVIKINYKKDHSFKSIKVKLKNGKIFNLGNGFSKNEKIPKIGDVVTFKYYGLSKNKIPKFASFLRIRRD